MRKRLVFGCLVPVVVVAGTGYWYFKKITATVVKPTLYDTVDRGDVDITVTELGIIESLKKVEVKSKVAGRVTRLYVDEGAVVNAGAPLADIDPTEINSEVAQIQAQLDGAQARLQQSARGRTYQINQTDAAIEQARESLKSAEARLAVSMQEARSQPGVSAADLAQAESALASARDAKKLLETATLPTQTVEAQTAVDDAVVAEMKARRNLDRQKNLLAQGFASPQAVDTAEAELSSVQSRLKQAQKRLSVTEEQNRLQAADADHRVDQAKLALDRARLNQSLVPIKNEEMAAARAAMEQAKTSLASALKARIQDRMREDDIAQARSSVVQLQNQLRKIEVQQGDTRLIAPMAGTVTKRYMEQGELVTSAVSTFSSGMPVLQISDLTRMRTRMSINEVDVHKIHAGQPVEIAIDGVRGVVFEGYVAKVSPGASTDAAQGANTVIKFAVEVNFKHADPRLKPGMSARCTIVIARKRGVLRLPVDAVKGEGAQASVELPRKSVKDGKPVETYKPAKIQAGLRGDSFIEVVSGLKQGDKVRPGVYNGPKRRAIDLQMGPGGGDQGDSKGQ